MTVPADDVLIRFARPSDGQRCNDFYNAYYGKSRTVRQWQWEFCRQVYDDGTIPFTIAEHDGQIVGSQALIPIELVDPAGAYWTAKSEETLVGPSMRGRGILTRLYAPLLQVARLQRYESIWGFTPASRAFEREGFACPTRTSQVLRCFDGDGLTRLLAGQGEAGRSRIRRAASIALSLYGTALSAVAPTGRTDRITTRIEPTSPRWADELSFAFARDWGGTTVHRSAAYMTWRYFENPFRRPIVVGAYASGEPVGWIAFGLGSSGAAAIVDLVVRRGTSGVSPSAIVSALVRESEERAREMGAAAMRAWHVSAHPFSLLVRRVLLRHGWLHVRRGFDMVLKFTPGIEVRESAKSIDDWYVTRAFTEGSEL